MWRAHPTDPDPREPALLQDTPGSTSRPKGVVVTHGNPWHQPRELDELWPTQPGEPTVSWLPMFHDTMLMYDRRTAFTGATHNTTAGIDSLLFHVTTDTPPA